MTWSPVAVTGTAAHGRPPGGVGRQHRASGARSRRRRCAAEHRPGQPRAPASHHDEVDIPSRPARGLVRVRRPRRRPRRPPGRPRLGSGSLVTGSVPRSSGCDRLRARSEAIDTMNGPRAAPIRSRLPARCPLRHSSTTRASTPAPLHGTTSSARYGKFIGGSPTQGPELGPHCSPRLSGVDTRPGAVGQAWAHQAGRRHGAAVAGPVDTVRGRDRPSAERRRRTTGEARWMVTCPSSSGARP